MYVINKPIFHPILESGKSIIVKREHMEQHALIVENLEEQLRIAANICIGALAIIGLAALVYPAPRAELLVVWKTILEELLGFIG